MEQIAAVILAAGSSSRYGQAKQLLDWHGEPLVAHVARIALAAGARPVVIVVRPEADDVTEAVSEAFRAEKEAGQVRIAVNWEPACVLSGSMRAGMAAVPPDRDGVIFLQGDAPLVSVELLQNLADSLSEEGALIAHPTVEGQLRPPVLFSRRLFSEIGALVGDQGGRDIVLQHRARAVPVELTRAELVADIDTPADYEMLLTSSDARGGSGQSGLDAASLAAIDGLIVDMDGVLWRSDTPLPGLAEFFSFLRDASVGFVLATNNSSLMPRQYSQKLARFGVDVPIEQVLTSAQATAAYVAAASSPGSRVYVIGGDGIRSALEAEDLELTDTEAEWVVVGWDRQLTWQKLETASLLIHRGARFVGTNPDRSYPTERGPAPGNGAQLAAIEATTGVAPIVVGKPEPWLYEQAITRLGTSPSRTAAVGDRLETDIAGGTRMGLATILVLSGIASRQDAVASQWKPDWVFQDIRDLATVWREVRSEHGILPPR